MNEDFEEKFETNILYFAVNQYLTCNLIKNVQYFYFGVIFGKSRLNLLLAHYFVIIQVAAVISKTFQNWNGGVFDNVVM